MKKDGRFKYNKLVLINFNDKIGGGQYKFNIIDNQGYNYNLYMWDKSGKLYSYQDFASAWREEATHQWDIAAKNSTLK